MPATADLDQLVVVMVRARNPLNIGAAARAMSNFGVHQLRLVNVYAAGFREARSAVGASELLQKAKEFDSVAEAVADCVLVVGTTAVRDRALQQPLLRLDEQAGAMIRAQLEAGRVAILFGSEKTGLSNDDFSHCHYLLNIPTSKKNISMNLGQAVAVCLYEMARSTAGEPPIPTFTAANAGELEKITQCLFDSLRISGYVKPGTDALFEKKARQLLLRFRMEAYDAKLFLGMMRQIAWKLRQPRKD